MYFIGLMSGTSMDAVDAVIVHFYDDRPDIDIVAYRQYPFKTEIQQRTRAVDVNSSLEEISELDSILGKEFANAVVQILRDSDIDKTDVPAVGSHGQTVLHLPDSAWPRTMQIGDANIICQHTGITTVADFRRADMAAGGQGAPLAPAFHAWKFRRPGLDRVVLNLGGMANITVLPAGTECEILGFDTGPGNALMDLWTQHHLGKDFDEQGTWAASGTYQSSLLDNMLTDPYFTAPPPKSTGKDDFNLGWLNTFLTGLDAEVNDKDIQATLLELSIRSISDAVRDYAPETEEIIICGGGIHNTALMDGLRQQLNGVALHSSAKYGLDPDAVEAVAFAWLAKQRLEGKPGNMPSVTGARRPVVLGALYEPVGR